MLVARPGGAMVDEVGPDRWLLLRIDAGIPVLVDLRWTRRRRGVGAGVVRQGFGERWKER